jgi:hypothetical protein
MKIITLSPQERMFFGFSHKCILLFSDLTAAALTQTFQIQPLTSGSFPATTIIEAAGWQLVTPFTGGAIATAVFDLGDPGAVGRYIANANTDIFTAIATNTKNNGRNYNAYAYAGNDAASNCKLQLKVTTTVGNVNAATAGQLEVYWRATDQSPLLLAQ